MHRKAAVQWQESQAGGLCRKARWCGRRQRAPGRCAAAGVPSRSSRPTLTWQWKEHDLAVVEAAEAVINTPLVSCHHA